MKRGKLYPHHNLYFVTSETWDLHALQAVLLSDMTRAFHWPLFDENARRLFPLPGSVSAPSARAALARCFGRKFATRSTRAGLSRDPAACNAAVAALYSLTALEQQALAVTRKVADAP